MATMLALGEIKMNESNFMTEKETKEKFEEYEEEEIRKRKEERKHETSKESKEPKKEAQKIGEITLKVPLVTLTPFKFIEEKEEVSKEVLLLTEKSKVILNVPFLSLSSVETKEKKLELDEKVSLLEAGREVRIYLPYVALSQPYYFLRSTELDCNVTETKETKKETKVPLVEITPPLNVFTPIAVDSKVIQIGESAGEKRTEEVKVEEGALPGGSSFDEKEVPDFLEFAFGKEGGKIRGKGPKIILFKDVEEDSYIQFLQNVCLRIYREIKGGEPRAKEVYTIDDLNRREIERGLEAGDKIFTINLDKLLDELKHKESEKDNIETHLQERLGEIYSEDLGFIIFTTKKKENFEKFKDILEKINLKLHGRLPIIYLEARRLPRDLIRLFSGMVELPRVVMEVEGKSITGYGIKVGEKVTFSFDALVNHALFNDNSIFNETFEEIKNEEGKLFLQATARSKEGEDKEKESDLHYNIKVFIVRYLVNELRKKGKALKSPEDIKKEIKTEKEENGVVPDVKVDNEVYEVETLFGEGVNADKKIDETINKYDLNKIKVNIVMDNFGFLLHMKDIIRRKKMYKEKVEFYTLDLKDKKLISLREFVEGVKKVLNKHTESMKT